LDPIECLKAINEVNHGRALRAVFRFLIRDMSPELKGSKKKVLWIGGPPSTGKSFFIRRLRKIFAGDEVDWRGEYLPVRISNRPEICPQLVTCEEFNFQTALGPQTLQTTKLLFEG
jgi:hypothetical protein